jgi:CubicO group peptidase (beta-lactamase class C family)
MSIEELAPSAAAKADWRVPEAHVERIRARLKETVDQGYFSGVSACAMPGDRLLHVDSYGVQDCAEANARPMGPDTIFRIASSTTPTIGVAMMLLHEEGKWRLDDLVETHIPEFKGLKVRAKDGSLVDPVQPMRMAHIMSHSAGLDRGFGGLPPAAGQMPQRPKDLRAMIEAMAATPLAYHPGKRWLYGPSVDVQGYIVEQLSGQRLDHFMEERVFGPLGMKDTGFSVKPDAVDRVASIFKYEGGKLERLNKPDPAQIVKTPSFFAGGGGLWSTPEDYRRFCRMLQREGAIEGGGRLLRAESVRLMRVNVLEPQVYVSAVQGSIVPGCGFGLDFAVVMHPEARDDGMGQDSYFWGGAFGTYFWIDPTNDLFVSGMVQIQNGGAQHLGMKVEYPDLKDETARLLYHGRLS